MRIRHLALVAVALTIAPTMYFLGAGVERARNAAEVKRHAGYTLAVIGLRTCDDFLGVITVSHDGTLRSEQGTTFAAARAIASTLPDGNSIVVMLPCAGRQT